MPEGGSWGGGLVGVGGGAGGGGKKIINLGLKKKKKIEAQCKKDCELFKSDDWIMNWRLGEPRGTNGAGLRRKTTFNQASRKGGGEESRAGNDRQEAKWRKGRTKKWVSGDDNLLKGEGKGGEIS